MFQGVFRQFWGTAGSSVFFFQAARASGESLASYNREDIAAQIKYRNPSKYSEQASSRPHHF
jgi:hypothetical protein